jgi:hypothetical protein
MRLTEARQGVRMLKFTDVFGRWEAAALTQLEAAQRHRERRDQPVQLLLRFDPGQAAHYDGLVC